MRDYDYKSRFVTHEYTEMKTYITEEITFNADADNVVYTITIPKGFAVSASDITVEGWAYTVVEDDPVLSFEFGRVSEGDTISLKYIVDGELLKYDIQSVVLDMSAPSLTFTSVREPEKRGEGALPPKPDMPLNLGAAQEAPEEVEVASATGLVSMGGEWLVGVLAIVAAAVLCFRTKRFRGFLKKRRKAAK